MEANDASYVDALRTLNAYMDIEAVVRRCVDEVEAVDVHTHLLPPTHGTLMLYGVDELCVLPRALSQAFGRRGLRALAVDAGVQCISGEAASFQVSTNPAAWFGVQTRLILQCIGFDKSCCPKGLSWLQMGKVVRR